MSPSAIAEDRSSCWRGISMFMISCPRWSETRLGSNGMCNFLARQHTGPARPPQFMVRIGRPLKKMHLNREDDMRVNCSKVLGCKGLGSKVLGSLAAGLFFMSAGAIAADAPKEMKLYVFSSGALNLDKSIIQNGSSGKVQIPVGFFLIRHPKGDVLFYCGNNDKIITNADYWGPFVKGLDPGRSPDIAIDTQLSKINVKPSDIKYVVLGHFHVDHAGNIGKFLESTFVYQRDEIRNAFWPAPGYATFFISDAFAMLPNSVAGPMPSKYNTTRPERDLDRFGVK